MASPKTVYALTLEPEACCLVRGQRSGRRVLTQVQAQSTSAHDLDFRTAVKSAELDVESGNAVWATSMPGVSSLLRWIPVPFSSIKKSNEVLPSLLDIQIPFPIESCIHGVARWTQEEGGTRALVYAAREEDVQACVQQVVDQSGADPEWLVHEGLVMAAAEHVGLGDASGVQLLLSACASRLSAAIVKKGEVDQFFSLRLAPAQPAGLTAGVQQLVDRLNRAPQGAGAIDHIVCFGAQALSEDDQATLRGAGSQSVTIQWADDPATLPTRLIAAYVLTKDHRELNLRQGAASHSGASMRSEQGVQSARRGMAVAAAALILLSAGWVGYLGHAESSLRAELTARAEALAPGKRIFPGQEVLIVKRALEESHELRQRVVAFSRGGVQASLEFIVAAAHHQDVQLRAVTLSDAGVEIQGQATAEQDAATFLSAIEAVTSPLLLKRGNGEQDFPFDAKGPGV